MRHNVLNIIRTRLGISIHTPHAGCDEEQANQWENKIISIHTPHAGCDIILVGLYCIYKIFQSTHPMRGATRVLFLCCYLYFISIHTPHAGCDGPAQGMLDPTKISIHTPHAGCDQKVIFYLVLQIYFNPHTPCGVRQQILTK